MRDFPAIRARMHDSALKRVSRSFSATLPDIFTETLQNARRAGATEVRVTLDRPERSDHFGIEVTDDGEGISDPSVLLWYGQNGWADDFAQQEDAAGMGMLSMARRGCVVVSRPRPEIGDPRAVSGFQVVLEPKHFLGEAEAEVHATAEAPQPHGTKVSFLVEEQENAYQVRSALEAAALHYPLPVRFEYAPHTPQGGELLPQRAFLDGAVSIKRWRGLTFGVFKNKLRSGMRDPDLNFFGLNIDVSLPDADTVFGATWRVAADVENCPELELVLPARKEAVETPFLAEMREAAQLAIFQAMAGEPEPRPTFDTWRKAQKAGINLPPPPPELASWLPDLADFNDFREAPKPKAVEDKALIVACDLEPPESQAFWRAARKNGLHERLFRMDQRLMGFDWYEAISRLTGLSTEITAEGRTEPLGAFAKRGGKSLPQRPELIQIKATIKSAAKSESRIDLPTDLAFVGEPGGWVEDALPLVTSNSDLAPCALADLMRDAFFSPSDDAGADSWESQRDDFEQTAFHMATRLLVSDDAARKQTIAEIVWRELSWIIPRDGEACITVRGREVDVALRDLETQART